MDFETLKQQPEVKQALSERDAHREAVLNLQNRLDSLRESLDDLKAERNAAREHRRETLESGKAPTAKSDETLEAVERRVERTERDIAVVRERIQELKQHSRPLSDALQRAAIPYARSHRDEAQLRIEKMAEELVTEVERYHEGVKSTFRELGVRGSVLPLDRRTLPFVQLSRWLRDGISPSTERILKSSTRSGGR